MNEAQPAPLWTSLLARLAGVWILFGCLMKAFLGTPGDLPPIVRHVPLPLGTLFTVVLGIEAFVGLGTLVRPGRAWPLAVALLLVFAGVATSQLLAGATSCGCFGGTITIAPWQMLAIDLVVLVALLLARPWRLARGGALDMLVAVSACVAAVVLPLAVDRQAGADATKSDGAGSGGVKLRRWVDLEMGAWKGKALKDTSLAKAITLPETTDGVWVFYRDSCEVCAGCLRWMSILEQGSRDVTMVKVPEKAKPGVAAAVHDVPRGPFVRRLELSADVDWVITTPARMIVKGGVVEEIREGVAEEDCR